MPTCLQGHTITVSLDSQSDTLNHKSSRWIVVLQSSSQAVVTDTSCKLLSPFLAVKDIMTNTLFLKHRMILLILILPLCLAAPGYHRSWGLTQVHFSIKPEFTIIMFAGSSVFGPLYESDPGSLFKQAWVYNKHFCRRIRIRTSIWIGSRFTFQSNLSLP